MLMLETETPGSKTGTLVLDCGKRKLVSILDRKTNGDTLIYDGFQVMILHAQSVVLASTSRLLSCGQKRLALVKRLYSKILSGEIDYNYIQRRIKTS